MSISEEMKRCVDCGKLGNGKYYYPFKGGLWLTQCKECAKAFQAFKPFKVKDL